MIKKISLNIVLITLLILVSVNSKAQTLIKIANRVSLTGGIGLSYYNGELNGDLWNIDNGVLNFGSWRIGLDYDINQKWRLGYSYFNGVIDADQKKFDDPVLVARGLAFEADITSHDFLVKYKLFAKNSFEFHLVGGGSHFNVSQVISTNDTITFRPTSINSGSAVDLGSEIILGINNNWAISVLSLYHQTFTDHLDGFSINSVTYDRYVNVTVGVQYRFSLGNGEGRIQNKNSAVCPAFN